jgi:hypothetical protein
MNAWERVCGNYPHDVEQLTAAELRAIRECVDEPGTYNDVAVLHRRALLAEVDRLTVAIAEAERRGAVDALRSAAHEAAFGAEFEQEIGTGCWVEAWLDEVADEIAAGERS